jgi:hypothetical protein
MVAAAAGTDALAAGVPLRDGRLIQPLAPRGAPEAFSEGDVSTAEAARADAAPATSAGTASTGSRRPAGEAPMTTAAVTSASAIAAAGTSCTPAWGTFRAGNWPSACWRPYGPSSPFNVPIPASPRIYGESASIIRYMTGHGWRFEHDEAGDFTWDAGGSRPVYWSTSSDPIITVTCRTGCIQGMRLHIPAQATPEAGSDAHMTVVDQERGREYDFWQATKPSNGQMTVSAGKSIPIGNETGTGLGGDAEAADLGLLGGIIRAPELAAGKIEHALVTTVKCVQEADVWPSPATGKGDAICPNAGLGPRFASLLQLHMSEAEIAATNAPAWQQTIMRAMAHYGVYVVDTQNSSSMFVLAEDDLSFTSFGYPGEMSEFVRAQGSTSGLLVGVPIETKKLRVIDPCVPQGTC